MKKILCLILVVLTILSNSLCVFAANTTVSSTTNITTENPGLKGQNSVKTSEAAFFADKLPKCEDLSPDKIPKYLKDNAKTIGLPQNGDFSYKKMSEDELGIKHLRYAQLYNGIPVFGKEIIVDVKGGEILSIQGMISPDASLQKVAVSNTSNTIDKNKAKGIAEAYINYKPTVSKQGSRVLDRIPLPESKCGDPELVWLDDNNIQTLAYSVNVSAMVPKIINKTLFIDAATGNIVKELDNIKTEAYKGTGRGVLNDIKSVNLYLYPDDSRYYLKDVTLGDTTGNTNKILTYNFNILSIIEGYVELMSDNNGKLCENSSEFLSQRAGVDTHYYFNLIYRYYRDVFKRVSFDNFGSNVISLVHYTDDGRPWAGAAWAGNSLGYFIIGDGDNYPGSQKKVYEFSASMDVLGHEFTHAVIDNNDDGGLNYQNQSGAIEESLADLFGQIIERKYKNDSDWTIGEDISIGADKTYKRSMSNPELYGQPANMSQYVYTSEDSGGVHINCGIPSKAAYLIASQLGDDKTAQLYYYTLMNELTSSADFLSLRRALMNSAKALYPGTGYQRVVAGAFDQVGITDPISITSINTDLESPQKTGTKIRWTCVTSGGSSPEYFFKIYKGSTLAAQSTTYSIKNYFDWTPTVEGTDYRATVYVKEGDSASSAAVTKTSDYYFIDNNTINKQLDYYATEWVIDDQNGYIYAVSQYYDTLLFIRLSDLVVEKTIMIGSMPSHLDLADGKIYVALSGANQIKIVDVASKAIEKTITTAHIPYSIAVDGSKIFSIEGNNQLYVVYAYDMGTNSWEDITPLDNFNPSLAVDRQDHILFAGESGPSGGNIIAISTDDYSTISQAKYEGENDLHYCGKGVVYDDGDVFYAGYCLDAGNLSIVNGNYDKGILYVKGNYVFSGDSVYDRNRYVKIKDLPISASNILMDAAGYTYLFDGQSDTLYKQHISYSLDTSMKHTNTLNNVVLDEKLTSWVSSEDSSHIYAVSESDNKLLFIRTSDLTVEKEMYVGSMPSDIELANGYLYIALSGSTKVIIIDPSTGAVSKRIVLKKCPYRIAVDGNKLFYVEYDQLRGLYVYDLNTGKNSSVPGANTACDPDLAVDRINHVLYLGESGLSEANIYSYSTIDYSQMSHTYGFHYPRRDVIYDAGNIYYDGIRLEANNLDSILGSYKEPIIYAKDTFVFSANHVFDRDSYVPVTWLGTADLTLMLNDGSYLLYNDQARSISKKGPLPLPVKIVSLAADKASPQLTNTKIRWTCNTTGGTKPVYYFKIYKGSTMVKSSTAYTSANYFDWTPTEAGTDYRTQVYVKENGAANSTSLIMLSSYYTIAAPAPIVIKSVVHDKASPQLTNTTIRWTCNITGGAKPVYYFRVYKGITLVKNSAAYSATNYFDWTPTEAGKDYRVLVNVKEDGTANSTSVAMYSGYYTVTAPIVISSLVPDKVSPQPTGTKIRWTCSITGGNKPVYYFKIIKGSTVVSSSTAYTTTNYFDWTPTEAGTDYRALVYVREPGSASSTIVTKYSSYYTVTIPPTPIVIKSVAPDKTSPQPTGTTVRWTCNITGGVKPVYYFRVYKGTTLVKNSAAYSASNYFDWTPTEAGTDYRILVNVKEDGTANSISTAMYSNYYTIAAPAPIMIKSVMPDKTSPQPINTTIRWTCSITGGIKPVYYFRVYKGTTLIKNSVAYSTANYFDWTPTEAGTDYRILVNVKEDGTANSTSVAMYSAYYTMTALAPKVIETPEPEATEPGLDSINIIDIPLVK